MVPANDSPKIDEEKAQAIQMNPKKKKCLYFNADSLLNKMEEAKQVIKLENPDIVAIVEVKPKNYRYLPTVTELSIEDYYLYEQNLEENTGRGIVCYCRKGINVHPISRSTDTIEPKESLWIFIKNLLSNSLESVIIAPTTLTHPTKLCSRK